MSEGRNHYTVELGGLEARLQVAPDESESGVAVVEHVLAPGCLGAPRHRHTREDEISRVVNGELTVQQGDETTTVGPGETVVKNRDVWHTFWNSGDEPVEFVEVIAPGEFAGYFEEAAALLPTDRMPDEETMDRLDELGSDYGLEFDPGSIPELTRQHELRF